MFPHGVTLVQNFVFGRLRRLFQSVCARLWCQSAAVPNWMSVRNVMKMRFMPLPCCLWKRDSVRRWKQDWEPPACLTLSLPVQSVFHSSIQTFSPSLPPRAPKEPAEDRLLFPQMQSSVFHWRIWPSFLWSAGVLCSKSLLCFSCVWKCSLWGLAPFCPAHSSPKPVPCLLWIVIENCYGRFYFWFPRKSVGNRWNLSRGKPWGLEVLFPKMMSLRVLSINKKLFCYHVLFSGKFSVSPTSKLHFIRHCSLSP